LPEGQIAGDANHRSVTGQGAEPLLARRAEDVSSPKNKIVDIGYFYDLYSSPLKHKNHPDESSGLQWLEKLC
jgi:hypothetical protein